MIELQHLARQNPRWSLEDFADVANAEIPIHLPEQKANTRIREEVNPRLIRQYTTLGLLDAPEREGREARYRYRHLLQLIVIRRMLAEGYGTAVIGKWMEGRSDEELEALIAGDTRLTVAPEPPPAGNAAMDFLKRLGGSPAKKEQAREVTDVAPPPASMSMAPAPMPPPAPAPMPTAAPAPLYTAPPAPLRRRVAPSPPPSPPVSSAEVWKRLEIQPGIELHLRDDVPLPSTPQALDALLTAIADHLTRLAESP